VILGGGSFILICLSSHRLYWFIYCDYLVPRDGKGIVGPRFRIAYVVLTLELLGSTMRFLLFSVDPFTSRNIYPYAFYRITLAIPDTCTFVSGVFLFFYWFELIKKIFKGQTLAIHTLAFIEGRLTKLIASIFTVAVACIELGVAIAGTIEFSLSPLVLMLPFVYAFLGIVFLSIGRYILWIINNNGNLESAPRLRRVTYRMMASAACVLLNVIFVFVLITPIGFGSPVPNLMLSMTATFMFMSASFFQIICFVIRSPKKMGDSSSSSDQKPTTIAVSL